MSKNSESLVFLSGKRTPFGSNGGSLKDISPTEMTVSAAKAAFEQSKIDPKEIDHIIIGHVLYSVPESIYVPRHVGLELGIPQEIPALGVNRLCGSGFQVIIEAYHQMIAGDSSIALVGGVENMSLSPYVMREARWGMKMGHSSLNDMMIESLYDVRAKLSMALTAENLAEKYNLTRDKVDLFALRSQKLCQEAQSSGFFSQEIAPFSIKDKKGKITLLSHDEHPKSNVTLDQLKKLKAVFKKEGVVTAGNASGIVDGAAVMIVATEKEAVRRKLKPLGRLVSYGITGCDPTIMGIGPVTASQQALKKAGMTLSQMDLIEINEAFASQTLAVEKELKIPREILNVNGGAIAMGHPLGASGVRIIQTLLYELIRRKKRYGLGSACIGGGQGIALVIESFNN